MNDMSYSSSDLKEIIRAVMQEEFEKRDGMKKLLDNQQPHAQHVMNCPDCYKDIIQGMNRTSEWFCEDCGLPLGSGDMAKEMKTCPRCNGTRAKRK